MSCTNCDCVGDEPCTQTGPAYLVEDVANSSGLQVGLVWGRSVVTGADVELDRDEC